MSYKNIKRRVPKGYQTGFSDTLWDLRYGAKMPGKRKSKTGSVYYEYRQNRSDLDRKQKL
jgi:hypothetical protein